MKLEQLLDYLYIVPAALIAIILHELAHGLVSFWLGDPTPKETGRLTLNPLKHLDPIGALCLIFFHFGWAKPVIINPSYYKNKKVGMTLVALAGPIMNFIIMIISFVIIGITYAIQYHNKLEYNLVFEFIYKFFSYLAILNIGLGVFNLIPVPPLDGSKAIGIVLPKGAYEEYMGYQKYGTFFMMGIMLVIYILSFFNIDSPILKITESIYNFFIELIYKIVM
ncbi:MAG: site-2 protease family protein [Bacilli bacterium]|nr:site-2 protease family protein [Mollicutes bacterium]MDY3899879.1 site-2 protease family protein [Bacilli bacterium]